MNDNSMMPSKVKSNSKVGVLILLAFAGSLYISVVHLTCLRDVQPCQRRALGDEPEERCEREGEIFSPYRRERKFPLAARKEETKVMTWSDTDSGLACHDMLPWLHEGQFLSFGVAWNEIRPQILNASYYPTNYTEISRFRDWVNDLFHFYTFQRLRRSQAHPAPSESMRQIMDLIRKRIDDPVHNEPIRIAVMGGSVTAGRDCDVNPLDLPGSNNRGAAPRWCAYPARLEELLNDVLFTSGQRRSKVYREEFPIFEVKNLAVQATNSAIGALSLEYKFISSLEISPPHVVIASYSANDARDEELETFQIHQQNFVHAAHNLRPCDDHLPLIVLADDRFGHGNLLTTALTNTGSIFKTASWYNLMAVMYTNVVRHQADATSIFNGSHPLFGSTHQEMSHLGMGFHIGQAWTLFFNLLSAMHDTCSDPGPFADAADDVDKKRTLTLVEPPTKYRGRYKWSGVALQEEWESNMASKARRCPIPPSTPSLEGRPTYSTSACHYGWMVDPMTQVSTSGDVLDALNPVMTRNVGWDVLYRYLKPVWFTNSTNSSATFTIELPNITMDVNSFTLLSVKSNTPPFNGSTLAIGIDVIPRISSSLDLSEQPSIRSSSTTPTTTTTTTKWWHVSGYHDKSTTVAFPTKVELPNGGARVGDTIRATFTSLRPGTTFMISGLAFCNSAKLGG